MPGPCSQVPQTPSAHLSTFSWPATYPEIPTSPCLHLPLPTPPTCSLPGGQLNCLLLLDSRGACGASRGVSGSLQGVTSGICLWSQNNLPLIIPIPHQHLLLLRPGFPGPSAVTGSWAGALITAFVLQSELIPHKAHFSQSGDTPRACEWCKLPQWLM